MARAKKPKADDAPYPPGWEPFLAAINANLDEDTPRLVFADWLQENGDEDRAEFIRIQCAIARGDTSGAERAESLFKEYHERWLIGLPKGLRERPDWCVFRRGFIAGLTTFGRYWASTSSIDRNWDAGGKAIRRITALEELRFLQPWNTLLESLALAGIRTLILHGAGSGLFESLAKSPILPSLIDLTFFGQSSNATSQRSVRELFVSRKLTQLRRLHVQSVLLGNTIAANLDHPRFASLQELRLYSVALEATGAESLARSPAMANLRVLDLHNNQIQDAGLLHLLSSPGLRNVEELCLVRCQLTSASARMLALWEGLQSVRVLDLRDNSLRPADALIISGCSHAKNLTEVRVGRQA